MWRRNYEAKIGDVTCLLLPRAASASQSTEKERKKVKQESQKKVKSKKN
jgi:hypothetical protein